MDFPMTPLLANITLLAYLVSAVLFILALKGLSSPVTSRRGNYFGMVGMLIAVVTTLFVARHPILPMIGIAIVIGGTIGAIAARRVQMTKMPELVALMHSLVGVSAVLIAVAALYHAGEEHTVAQKIELFIGAFIGAITFTASLVAFGKLSGRVSGTPISFGGQHRRRRYAGRGVDAEQLFRLGGRRYRLYAQQFGADHRRFMRWFVRRHFVLHHVQGHESIHHCRAAWWLWCGDINSKCRGWPAALQIR
jgi:hypothetical protein